MKNLSVSENAVENLDILCVRFWKERLAIENEYYDIFKKLTVANQRFDSEIRKYIKTQIELTREILKEFIWRDGMDTYYISPDLHWSYEEYFRCDWGTTDFDTVLDS